MLTRAVTYTIFMLYLTLGATFNGIVQPQIRLLSLTGLILIGTLWLIARRHKRWHASTLDIAILVWIAAFCASLITNLDQARRIAIGIWYAGAYILVWYMLYDLLANRIIARRILMNALLLSGFLILAFGYLQIRAWISDYLPLMLNGIVEFTLPRPVSTLGNPNTLGAFLAVLIPFALEAIRSSKGIPRVFMVVYTLLCAGLLVLTYSRGAWIGAAAGVGIYILLLASRGGFLSLASWRNFWSVRTIWVRSFLVVTILAAVVTGTMILVIVAGTFFSIGGRSFDTRTWIYSTAMRMFEEQPIAGSGLFTFGTGIARYNGNPPYEPHAHAHNIVLHIAAELGIVGLIALGLTIISTIRALLRNLRSDTSDVLQYNSHSSNSVISAGAGAVVAFGVHQLFDVPTMTPAIALTCLVALVITTAPLKPNALVGIKRHTIRVGLAFATIALGITGYFSALVYQNYATIIGQTTSGNLSPKEGADLLESVIDADPFLSLYSYEQGFLYGLAGETQLGIEALERYTQLEPDYSIGWINLFALYKEAGEMEQALYAISRANQLNQSTVITLLHLAETEALLDDLETARENYRIAVQLDPDLQMLPAWNNDPIRRNIETGRIAFSAAGETIRLLQTGNVTAAREAWVDSDYRAQTASRTSAYIIDALVALHANDRASAATALSAAEAWLQGQGDIAWLHYGIACAARYEGNESTVLQEIRIARNALVLEPFAADWGEGASIGYTQLLTTMIPRVFLPEVDYPIVSPIAASLLEAFDATPETNHTSCP